MGMDIVEVLDDFIPMDNPRKWAKLSSTVDSRRLELSLLREILLELRKLNENVRGLTSLGRHGD
jgi:hypothetical protein